MLTSPMTDRRPKRPLIDGVHDCEQRQSSNMPSYYAPPLAPPLQEPSTRQRKRPRSSQSEPPRPPKQRQTNPQSMSDRSLPLTKHNLQKHTLLLMDSEAGSPGRRVLTKRSASGESATQQTGSLKSSGTSANYRYVTLHQARIRVHHSHTPDEIRTQIDAVIQPDVSSKRKEELSRIAQELCRRFIQVITQAFGEDDCIEPFYSALDSMGYSESLAFVRKAGILSLLNPCTSWYSLRL